jgi:protein-tyrosine phosphatase
VKDEVVNQCYKFIEDALNQGESVIVHSVRGHNRSVCVLCLYFMKKYATATLIQIPMDALQDPLVPA